MAPTTGMLWGRNPLADGKQTRPPMLTPAYSHNTEHDGQRNACVGGRFFAEVFVAVANACCRFACRSSKDPAGNTESINGRRVVHKLCHRVGDSRPEPVVSQFYRHRRGFRQPKLSVSFFAELKSWLAKKRVDRRGVDRKKERV